MPKKTERKIHIVVPNMMCVDCVQYIKAVKQILKNNGNISVGKIFVDPKAKRVVVVVPDNTPQSDKEIEQIIKKELRKKSFKVETPPLYSYVIKGLIGSLIGLTLLIIMACGFVIPMIAMYIIAGLASLLTLYLGFDTFKSAIIKLFKTRSLSTDMLFTVSAVTAIGVSIAAFFVPWLPMMFDVALLIFGFKHLGAAIEEAARRKILKGVTFRDRIPDAIELEEKDNQGNRIRKIVSVEKLKSGDSIFVRGGAIIPVDGKCDDEESFVYETIYNGNTTPTKIKKDHQLRGGMRVREDIDGIRINVTASAEDSYPALVDTYIYDTQVKKAPIENTIDKILRYFVPAVFGLAIISGIIIGCLFPPAIAIQCVISILVSACPCTLGFIIPLTVNIAVDKGRNNNVEFKGRGSALQAAAEVDTVVFDLNGTLTTGKKKVNEDEVIIKDKTLTKTQIADYLYLLEEESKSKHAVARAISRYAKKYKSETTSTYKTQLDTQKNNSGVRCKIDDAWYTLGNHTMMVQHNVDMSKCEPNMATESINQNIYLARDKEIIAVINVADPIRKDAQLVINQLKQAGKKIYLCTGADFRTAKMYADKLGIENINADCIPFKIDEKNPTVGINKQTKTDVIRALQKKGCKIAFVGDGDNDAPVMNECLGIVIKSHASDELAEDNAEVIVEGDFLQPILSAFAIAKQSITNIKLSLGISLAYNMATLLVAGGLLVVIGFTLNPAIGVALMIVQACFVLAMAYYFKRKALPKLSQQSQIPVPENKNTSSTNKLTKFFRAKPTNDLVVVPNQQNHAQSSPPLTRLSAMFLNLFRKSPANGCKNTCSTMVPETRYSL